MKRRHFISFVFVLILCIGMIGCGKEKKTTASDKFQSDYMEIGVGTTVEKGYFGVINGLLYYVDFETMNAVPICNKPDCRHISWMEDRNTKCNAANTDIWNLFPYKGKLYGFRSLADGGSELVVSDLDGSNWKSKGMFIKAEESFHEGVVVKDQMFYLKDVALREEEAAEPELETVMCMLDLDTMKSREICRERGTFSIQFLGGTKDYQIYYVVGIAGPYHTELKKWCHEIVEIPNRDALLSLDVITSFSGATYILDIFFALLLSKRYEEHARSSMEMLNHLSLLWDETYHTKEKNE